MPHFLVLAPFSWQPNDREALLGRISSLQGALVDLQFQLAVRDREIGDLRKLEGDLRGMLTKKDAQTAEMETAAREREANLQSQLAAAVSIPLCFPSRTKF